MSAGTLNCVYDVDIDRIMKRTRYRPLPAGRIYDFRSDGACVRDGRAFVRDLLFPRRSFGRMAFARGKRVLRRDLHDAAQAPHAAEHRHRRRRRIDSAAGRLGCGDAHDRRSRARLVRDHLPVDAAAFLGARAHDRNRLRQSRRTDAAERHGEQRTKRDIFIYTIVLLLASLAAVLAAARHGTVLCGGCRRARA